MSGEPYLGVSRFKTRPRNVLFLVFLRPRTFCGVPQMRSRPRSFISFPSRHSLIFYHSTLCCMRCFQRS